MSKIEVYTHKEGQKGWKLVWTRETRYDEDYKIVEDGDVLIEAVIPDE